MVSIGLVLAASTDSTSAVVCSTLLTKGTCHKVADGKCEWTKVSPDSGLPDKYKSCKAAALPTAPPRIASDSVVHVNGARQYIATGNVTTSYRIPEGNAEGEDHYTDPYIDDEILPEYRGVPEASDFPPEFRVEHKTATGLGMAIGMAWLDTTRALILEKTGIVWICEPDTPGFPKQVYMEIPKSQIYNTDETGALAIAVDPDFNAGKGAKKSVYIYYGAFASNGLNAGMRLSRFHHNENSGGLSSRLVYGSEKIIWHDTDGWGVSPQWHYGGALEFGPSKKLF